MRLLWTVITVCVVLAIAISGDRAASLPLSATIRDVMATSLLLGGLVLRWAAFVTGDTIYREPLTHWAENIGTTTIRLVLVELRKYRGAAVLRMKKIDIAAMQRAFDRVAE